MTSLAALLVAAELLLIGCRSAPHEPTAPATPPPAADTSPLSDLLLAEDEVADDLLLDETVSGPVDPSFLEGELAVPGEPWPPEGFVEAAQHVFLLSTPLGPDATDQDVRGAVNLGMLFRDPGSARSFLDRSFPPEFQLEDAHPFGYERLGEERRGLRTEASPDRPVRTTLMWQRGRTFLQLNVYGDYELEEIMSWALAVDGRAKGA